MKKSEIQHALTAARATAQVDPQAALRELARLNVVFDYGLQRISKAERDILLANNDRALVRLESQTSAFSRGELIL